MISATSNGHVLFAFTLEWSVKRGIWINLYLQTLKGIPINESIEALRAIGHRDEMVRLAISG